MIYFEIITARNVVYTRFSRDEARKLAIMIAATGEKIKSMQCVNVFNDVRCPLNLLRDELTDY